MSWQKCPICNGEGFISNNYSTSAVFKDCPTCNGQRIINEITGFPPSSLVTPSISPEQKAAEIKSIMERTEELTKKNKP